MSMKTARRNAYNRAQISSVVLPSERPQTSDAAKIENFNWFALLDTADTRIIKSLFIHKGPRGYFWTGRGEYYGFEFDLVLYEEDVRFLNETLGRPHAREGIWIDTLPQKLDIQLRKVEPKRKKAIGVAAIWHDGNLITPLPADDYPAEFAWMPAISKHGIKNPPFVHPREAHRED